MRREAPQLAAFAVGAVLLAGCGAERTRDIADTFASVAASSVTIDNQAIWRDTDGQEIKAQGGGIIEVGGVYHWFGPDFGGAGDYHFYAIQHYSSPDLKTWTKRAPALRPGMAGVPFSSTSWVGRPWVMWNPNDNRFVMAIEWGGGGGVRNQYAFLTSPSIDGPWTYQSAKLIRRLRDTQGVEYNLGDMGVYTEGNSAWLLYTFDKPQPNYAQAILKLGGDFMTPLAPVAGNYVEFSGGTWQAGVQEAAHVFKRNGRYYYFTSLCNGWKSSQTRYRTAASMAGPWTSNAIVPTNPPSSNSFNTQHDFVLPIPGPATTYVYFGDRWSNFRAPTGSDDTGRYGWFPLSFDATGVPTINAPNYAANGGDWQLQIGASAPVSDQLQNPGFESDFQHWTFSGNASIATAAAEVHSGTKAVKAWSRTAYQTTVQNASASNSAGGTYSATVWSRAGGSFNRRVFEVYV
ncbi:MAG TPA: family 43 glycosylhydrolase, partial [Polyangiaceae bacterium]|nr:family 43 glycosylhydrolase [Polyangiaceae bacterium]